MAKSSSSRQASHARSLKARAVSSRKTFVMVVEVSTGTSAASTPLYACAMKVKSITKRT